MAAKKQIKLLYDINQTLKHIGDCYFIFGNNMVVGINENNRTSNVFAHIESLPDSILSYQKEDNVIFISAKRLYNLFKEYKNSQISEMVLQSNKLVSYTDDGKEHIFGSIQNIFQINKYFIDKYNEATETYKLHLKKNEELSEDILNSILNSETAYITSGHYKFILSKPVITNLKKTSTISISFIDQDVEDNHLFRVILSNHLNNGIRIVHNYMCTNY